VDWLALPAQTFDWLDLRLATWLPESARLVAWSTIAGLLAMLSYAALSPQRQIARVQHRLAQTQNELTGFDGDLSAALPLIGRMLRAAFAQLGLVAGPSLIALAPMVLMAGWIAQNYGYAFPPAQIPVMVRTAPDLLPAQWIPTSPYTRTPRVALSDPQGRPLGDIEIAKPVPVIQKRTWQAALAGSPLGFLPDTLPVDRVEFELPAKQYLSWGPGWMRGWEFTYFSVLSIVALAIKQALRLR
jgi:hypothetical protein